MRTRAHRALFQWLFRRAKTTTKPCRRPPIRPRIRPLTDTLAILRCTPTTTLSQELIRNQTPLWLARTKDELSIVVSSTCAEELAAQHADAQLSRGWRAIQLEGPLDFSLVGVLADVTAILAKGAISVFALSTFDTDYVLVRCDLLDAALGLLGNEGYMPFEHA